MFHKIPDQEKNPEKYVLKSIDPSLTEDECFDLLSKPRQTQKTIGLYLKKIKDSEKDAHSAENVETKSGKKRFSLTKGSHYLEREVKHNKGFWVGKPQVSAHLTYKLRDRYEVEVPRKTQKGQGIFHRPEYLELDYLKKLAMAGKLHSDEDTSDSEEENVKPDDTTCLALRRNKYKICDPCKVEEKKKETRVEKSSKNNTNDVIKGGKRLFRKIPTGCQCNYYGEHHVRPTAWDTPFEDEVDMIRQHEMNKVMKPYKNLLLNENYEKQPPVKYMAHEFGMKRTFPLYLISNL